MNILKHFITLFICCISASISAGDKNTLTFNEYLNRVKISNIGYLAEKYNVDIAEAKAKAAKVLPDPELSVNYSNNQNWDLQMGYGFDAELSYTVEFGGKRKARMRVAQSEKEITGILVEDYFHDLRADAAIAYLTALKQKKLCEIEKSSYEQMLRLAQADSLRFRLGSITEIDAMQSKLEAGAMLNELYSSEGELRKILLQLPLFQGNKNMETPDSIAGELSYRKREFDLQSLVVMAQNNRCDLEIALKSKELSQNNLRLAKANRSIDLGIHLGGSYSSKVLNEIAPAPAFKGVTAGISIPLKFSNTNKGELRAAQLAATQSEKQYEAVEIQIATEVMQAYDKYKTACIQVEQFNTNLLREAEIIFKKKMYGYERGETSILELLNSRRTYNEIQIAHIEMLYNCTLALIELERAIEIWDIEI
ncbi:MAG: TolC family protein [Prevotellaceae bacterium]|jgi:cobalt-zinc-cadmium efflux system outer membrane protein|nr:TolC family protein [Prevotellaceae bacterium]